MYCPICDHGLTDLENYSASLISLPGMGLTYVWRVTRGESLLQHPGNRPPQGESQSLILINPQYQVPSQRIAVSQKDNKLQKHNALQALGEVFRQRLRAAITTKEVHTPALGALVRGALPMAMHIQPAPVSCTFFIFYHVTCHVFYCTDHQTSCTQILMRC